MAEIHLTVIIPHYDIPDLLMRCLRSIPVCEEIQVIVVDDCSPGFASYQEAYPELYRPYTEVYSTSQGGSAGRARNEGLKHAKGKWICFIDADDFFTEQLALVLDIILDKEEDIVFTMHKSVLCENPSVSSDRNLYHLRIKEKYLETKDENLLRFHFDPLWGKFFRRTMVEENQIRFDETKYSNDVMFSLRTGAKAKSVTLLPTTAYVLTERVGSLDYEKQKPLGEWCVRFEVLLDAYHYCKENGLPCENFDPFLPLQDLKGYCPSAFYHQLFLNLQKGRFSLLGMVALRLIRNNLRKLKNDLLKHLKF